MFYKLVDEYTIEKFKNPLMVDNKHIFTNSESVLNENGYYKLVINPMPEEEEENKYYINKYVLDGNIIYKIWEQKEIEEDDMFLTEGDEVLDV